MKNKGHKIIAVLPGSVGEEMGIEKGDFVLSVNGREIEDVFDWESLITEENFILLIRKPSGEEWELEIEMEPEEELGLSFESDLMSDYRHCQNQCIFCFIDQMPPGMRETLYFKDDDSRLSFLQGNYITLTNMKEEEVRRMISYRMEPMNISVHTTNPKLRETMLRNKRAGEVLSYLDLFYEANLTMNAQIVLCKGYNDREELKRTIEDLMKYAPVLQSVSVVPVGLTKYRDGLTLLEPFTKEDAISVIDLVEHLQKQAISKSYNHFVHASDEFYILAERDFPDEGRYDGYLQLENGVGMARSFLEDGKRFLAKKTSGSVVRHRKITFATGVLAKPILEKMKEMTEAFFGEKLPLAEIVAIENRFFGEKVTVAGLITGADLISGLKGREFGEAVCIPSCMLRSGEEVFLDDVTLSEAESKLGVPVKVLSSSAEEFICELLGEEK